MKKKLMDLCRERNKPYGILVRRMDFPSLAPPASVRELLRPMRSGGPRVFSTPLIAYRVYADGREELVRGLRFRGFTVRVFRDILAAGDTPASAVDGRAAIARP